MRNYKIAIICLSLLSIGLLIYIYRIPKPGLIPSDKPLRDSITLIGKQRLELELQISSKNRAYDSLLILKQKTYPVYYEKLKFLSGASPDQCDSIICLLSGLPRHY